MREIKLRYKCRNKDKLFYDGDDNFAYITRHKIIALGNGGMLFAEETMQYTGLTDKNGKEIYEGDRVKYATGNPDNPTIIEDVVFKGGAFYPVCTQPSETFEVVGNIYETPELLNEGK